jgi:hypothetical protein
MRSGSLGIGLVFVVGLLVTGCSASSEEPGGNDAAPDVIQQAVVVLGDEYTYEELKTATDVALMNGGEGLTESSRTAVWDSILGVKKGLIDKGYPEPDSMDVLECIPGSIATRAVELTEAIAYCSLEVAGISESLW